MSSKFDLKRRLGTFNQQFLRELLNAWNRMDQVGGGRFYCRTVWNNGCVYNHLTGASYALKCFFLSLGCMIAHLENRSVEDSSFVNQKALELLTKANHTITGKIVTLDPYDSNDDLATIERLLRTLPHSIRVEIYAVNIDDKISPIPDRVINPDGRHVARIANPKMHFEYITNSSDFFYSREVISFLKDTDAVDYRYIPGCINEILTDICSRNRPIRPDDERLSDSRAALRNNSVQLEKCKREAEELRRRLRELEAEEEKLKANDSKIRRQIFERVGELSETGQTVSRVSVVNVSVSMRRAEEFNLLLRGQQEALGSYYAQKLYQEELVMREQMDEDEKLARQIQELDQKFNSF